MSDIALNSGIINYETRKTINFDEDGKTEGILTKNVTKTSFNGNLTTMADDF